MTPGREGGMQIRSSASALKTCATAPSPPPSALYAARSCNSRAAVSLSAAGDGNCSTSVGGAGPSGVAAGCLAGGGCVSHTSQVHTGAASESLSAPTSLECKLASQSIFSRCFHTAEKPSAARCRTEVTASLPAMPCAACAASPASERAASAPRPRMPPIRSPTVSAAGSFSEAACNRVHADPSSDSPLLVRPGWPPSAEAPCSSSRPLLTASRWTAGAPPKTTETRARDRCSVKAS
mmetsp:Transcript_105520/g.315171  ORF Transcript_105520/g.315171 Transcript_105520/m.315171 type:complete len:237 (+) Transcript_105520:511-1221(+)